MEVGLHRDSAGVDVMLRYHALERRPITWARACSHSARLLPRYLGCGHRRLVQDKLPVQPPELSVLFVFMRWCDCVRFVLFFVGYVIAECCSSTLRAALGVRGCLN